MRRTDNNLAAGLFMRSLFLDMIPLLSILGLILLTTLPIGLPVNTRIGGLWPLTGLTYWILVRPRSMPPVLVFLLGLVMDIVSFLPLGIHGFVFLLSQRLLQRQRRFLMGQGFWVLWAAFALQTLTTYCLLWALIDLSVRGNVPFLSGLWGMGLAWASAPIVFSLLSQLNDTIDLFDEPVL